MNDYQWALYFDALGNRAILPPLKRRAAVDPPPHPLTFKVVAFNRGRITTSTNQAMPYLTNYPSYHSWLLETTRPSEVETGRDDLNEHNAMALLKGGCIGRGPIIFGSGCAAIAFKSASHVTLFGTLRMLYDTYKHFSPDVNGYLNQESKFIVSVIRFLEKRRLKAPSVDLMWDYSIHE